MRRNTDNTTSKVINGLKMKKNGKNASHRNQDNFGNSHIVVKRNKKATYSLIRHSETERNSPKASRRWLCKEYITIEKSLKGQHSVTSRGHSNGNTSNPRSIMTEKMNVKNGKSRVNSIEKSTISESINKDNFTHRISVRSNKRDKRWKSADKKAFKNMNIAVNGFKKYLITRKNSKSGNSPKNGDLAKKARKTGRNIVTKVLDKMGLSNPIKYKKLSFYEGKDNPEEEPEVKVEKEKIKILSSEEIEEIPEIQEKESSDSSESKEKSLKSCNSFDEPKKEDIEIPMDLKLFLDSEFIECDMSPTAGVILPEEKNNAKLDWQVRTLNSLYSTQMEQKERCLDLEALNTVLSKIHKHNQNP